MSRPSSRANVSAFGVCWMQGYSPAGGPLIDFSEGAPVLQTAVSSESAEKQMELTVKMMKQTGFA